MVVGAAWPGATVEETMQQVTERLERDAPGDPPPRPRAQLHDRRPDDDLRRTRAVDAAVGGPRRLVPGPQEHRRHAPDAAAPAWSGRSSTTTSATPSASSTASPPTASLPRAARLRRGGALAAAAGAGRLEDRGPRRAGRADLHRVLDRAARRPAPGLPPIVATLQAQNVIRPAGVIQTERRARVPARQRRLRLRADIESVNLVVGDRIVPAGRHRDRPARLRRPAAADVPRQRQACDRPRDRDARRGRHPGARREPAHGDGRRSRAEPAASASSPRSWPTRPSPSTWRSTTS